MFLYVVNNHKSQTKATMAQMHVQEPNFPIEKGQKYQEMVKFDLPTSLCSSVKGMVAAHSWLLAYSFCRTQILTTIMRLLSVTRIPTELTCMCSYVVLTVVSRLSCSESVLSRIQSSPTIGVFGGWRLGKSAMYAPVATSIYKAMLVFYSLCKSIPSIVFHMHLHTAHPDPCLWQTAKFKTHIILAPPTLHEGRVLTAEGVETTQEQAEQEDFDLGSFHHPAFIILAHVQRNREIREEVFFAYAIHTYHNHTNILPRIPIYWVVGTSLMYVFGTCGYPRGLLNPLQVWK